MPAVLRAYRAIRCVRRCHIESGVDSKGAEYHFRGRGLGVRILWISSLAGVSSSSCKPYLRRQKLQAFRGMVCFSRVKKHCCKAGGKEPCFATRAASCCRKARAHADWVSGEEQLVNSISPFQTRLLHGRWLWKNMSVGGWRREGR